MKSFRLAFALCSISVSALAQFVLETPKVETPTVAIAGRVERRVGLNYRLSDRLLVRVDQFNKVQVRPLGCHGRVRRFSGASLLHYLKGGRPEVEGDYGGSENLALHPHIGVV